MPCRFPPLFPFCQACALVIAGGLFGADESTESCSSEDFTAPSFSFVFSSRPFPFSTTFPLQCVSFCFVLFFHIYLTLSSSALFSCPSMSRSAVCYCSHFLCSLYLTWILVLNFDDIVSSSVFSLTLLTLVSSLAAMEVLFNLMAIE